MDSMHARKKGKAAVCHSIISGQGLRVAYHTTINSQVLTGTVYTHTHHTHMNTPSHTVTGAEERLEEKRSVTPTQTFNPELKKNLCPSRAQLMVPACPLVLCTSPGWLQFLQPKRGLSASIDTVDH